jgi:hypothetical protein
MGVGVMNKEERRERLASEPVQSHEPRADIVVQVPPASPESVELVP